MLCEQLVLRAASVSSEKSDLKQKLALQSAKYKALLEKNHNLSEQASLHAANNKRELPSSTEQDRAIQLMPMAPYGRLPLSWQAFTLAQVTASNKASAGVDEGLGSDCSSVDAAATMATTAELDNCRLWLTYKDKFATGLAQMCFLEGTFDRKSMHLYMHKL
ncbi:unnamed protein product [Sphagnum jensenii]|uniref:Uncharacterized protein n=1 Tax=Sphagnum jensenii TaxID=128206 RepID=A0ABP1BLE4_9BRYO